MMLGDSVTFGWGALPDAITSNVLEEHINGASRGKLIEVLNTGIGPVIVSYPERHSLDPYPSESVKTALRQASSLPVIDLTGSLKDLPPQSLLRVTKTDAHANNWAAERFAAAIEKQPKSRFPELLRALSDCEASQ